MRPDRSYLTLRFQQLNAQCFGGQLPPIALRISHARSRLGSFAYLRSGSLDKCRIALSDAFDLPQDTVDDTILHEMIHYYLYLNRLSDPTPHGPNFRALMARINAEHGRDISVRGHLDAATRETAARPRRNCICITSWADGSRGVTVCTHGYAGAINRAFKRSPSIKSAEWFVSTDPWFSRYPLLRSAKAHVMPPDFPFHLLTPITG